MKGKKTYAEDKIRILREADGSRGTGDRIRGVSTEVGHGEFWLLERLGAAT